MAKYVIGSSNLRKCEFEFCSSTQEHYCNSLKDARDEIEQIVLESQGDLEEKDFVIYEIKLIKRE